MLKRADSHCDGHGGCDRFGGQRRPAARCGRSAAARAEQALVGVCLKLQLVFPFSPSAFQASLQTSIFQVRNRPAGAAMSLIKKSDVKNHLSPRYRTKIHLCQPVSQPDATGYSVAEPDIIRANQSNFAADFVAEHSSPGVAATPGGHLPGSFHPETPTVAKNVPA